MLASSIRSPALYDPETHPEAALDRWKFVLNGMVTMGKLAEADVAKAKYPKVRAKSAAGNLDVLRAFIIFFAIVAVVIGTALVQLLENANLYSEKHQPIVVSAENTYGEVSLETPAYFVAIDFDGDRVVSIHDFLYARYAMDGVDLSPLNPKALSQ